MKIQAWSPLALQRSSSRFSCVSHDWGGGTGQHVEVGGCLSYRRVLEANAPSAPASAPRVFASSGINDSMWLGMVPGFFAASPTSEPYSTPLGRVTGTTILATLAKNRSVDRSFGNTLLATIENCGSTDAITIRS